MPKSRRGLPPRTAKGQLEFLVSIIVIAMVLVIGASFLLIDEGVSAYYKDKLIFITAQGAAYAAAHPGANQYSSTVQLVTDLCTKMGLRPSNLTVQVGSTQKSGQAATLCSADANFPLIQGSFLPGSVNMSASTIASNPGNGAPTAVIDLTVIGNSNQFIDKIASTSGAVTGNTNIISVLPQPSSNIHGGPGTNIGIGNIETGGGTAIGIGNSSTGGGTAIGNDNTNSGSGTAIGNNNNGSGAGVTIGNDNSNSTSIQCIGNGNVVN